MQQSTRVEDSNQERKPIEKMKFCPQVIGNSTKFVPKKEKKTFDILSTLIAQIDLISLSISETRREEKNLREMSGQLTVTAIEPINIRVKTSAK